MKLRISIHITDCNSKNYSILLFIDVSITFSKFDSSFKYLNFYVCDFCGIFRVYLIYPNIFIVSESMKGKHVIHRNERLIRNTISESIFNIYSILSRQPISYLVFIKIISTILPVINKRKDRKEC